MATSLLVLLDDIASILDDVSLMTKVAAKKTAGVLGDDLALNAQQVSGVKAERELPVVWAVAKGSFRNKIILVPAALLISALAPWLITPLLMLGGAYLCYEGAEKLAHKFLHDAKAEHTQTVMHLSGDPEKVVAKEKAKIAGAVRTDFILSAEIIAITLGTVAGADFLQQVIVLSGIAIIMTVGVYGLVAGIVKLDDAGLALTQRAGGGAQKLGAGILWFAPWLMRTLSVVGTAAMFMVGGGILVHGVEIMSHWIENSAQLATGLPYVGTVLGGLLPTLLNAGIGIAVGAVILTAVTLIRRLRPRSTSGA
jgi:predicted DNA repair protein MutK